MASGDEISLVEKSICALGNFEVSDHPVSQIAAAGGGSLQRIDTVDLT